jgi:hypothetical protein
MRSEADVDVVRQLLLLSYLSRLDDIGLLLLAQ